MTTQKLGYGTQETVDGAPALRFVRTLPYSQQRIWQAAATPSELEQWFPAAVEWGPESGETLEAYGMTGEVLEAQEPNLLVWTFNGDGFRFEITGDEETTQLTFVHIFGDPATPAAQTATGWHTYLDRLEPVLPATRSPRKPPTPGGETSTRSTPNSSRSIPHPGANSGRN